VAAHAEPAQKVLCGGEVRMFFFEKKNQKTFALRAEPVRKGRSQTEKSFLLLFFKKEALSS
jgi:hypothetical protein